MLTDTAAERRFLLLKKRLDALHYCQPLTIESSALVEKLLNDLVKTTEGFQQQKKQLEEGTKNEHLLAPLKKEIARLTQENNQLHLSMIQVKEDCEFKDNKWRAQVRMLENERNDWKFILTQRNTQEKKLQEEVIRLKSRGSENKDPNFTEEYRKLLDRMNEAQQQYQVMVNVRALDSKDQVRLVEQNAMLMEEKLRHLESQVANRDQEIARMKQKLELGSTNMDRLASDYQLQEQLQKVQRLTTQLDLITQENTRLHEELELNRKQVKLPRETPTKQPDQRHLKKEIDDKTQQIESLKQQLDDANSEIEQLRSQLNSLTLQSEELIQKAIKAENVVQAYQSDKAAFNRVMDKLKSQQDTVDNTVEIYKVQIMELNKVVQQHQDRYNHLEAVQQGVLREKELLGKQLHRANEELTREIETAKQLKEQMRRSEQTDSLQQRNNELLQEVQELKLDKSEAQQQIKLLQDTLQKLKYENGAIAEKVDEFNRFEQEGRQLQAQLRALEKRNQSLMEENHQMKLDRIERDQQLKVQQESLQRSKIENDKLMAKISELTDHTGTMQSSMRRAQERDTEFSVLASELERVRDSERRLIIQTEKLTAESTKMEVYLANCNKNIEVLTRGKEDLLREVKDLRSQLQHTKLQDNDTKNVSLQLNERLNSQHTALEDMRELLLREQKRTSKLSSDLNEQRQLYLNTQSQLEESLTQVKQLKSLSESLERSREELLVRLQAKNSEKLDEERLLSAARSEQLKVEERLKHAEMEVQQTRKALEQVDQERDEMQYVLDEKTEENVQLQTRIQKLNEELDKQQSKLVEIQSRGDRGFETVSALEEKLREGQFKAQRMQAELENLRYTLSVKEKNLGEMTTDLQILSRENQSLTQQVARSVQEKEVQQQQQVYSQQQELRSREQLRLTEMEMRDLQTNYSEVVADNQRLQSSMQSLSYQHQELLTRIAELEKEDDFLSQQVQNAQRKEETYHNQITQLERELQQFARRCEEQERLLRDSQRQQEQLLREYNSQRRVSHGFQNSQEDLQRQLANFDHERKLSADALLAIRRELEIKEAHFDLERKRASELEIVLVREREQHMRLNEEILGLRQQNEALLNELEKQNLRFQSMSIESIMVSGDAPYIEQQELAHEISQLRVENQRLKLENIRRSTDSGDKSREENSRLEQSAAWERLRQESEVFKKSINQTAMSSNYLKMKMKNLQKEYEQVLPPHGNKYM